MFRDEVTLVHSEKVHFILDAIEIKDDETMFAVLAMDDEHLNCKYTARSQACQLRKEVFRRSSEIFPQNSEVERSPSMIVIAASRCSSMPSEREYKQ